MTTHIPFRGERIALESDDVTCELTPTGPRSAPRSVKSFNAIIFWWHFDGSIGLEEYVEHLQNSTPMPQEAWWFRFEPAVLCWGLRP